VIGVVGDVRQYSLRKGLPSWIPGAMYMPYPQSVREDGEIPATMTLLVKARSSSSRLQNEIRKLAKDQDPNAPVGRVQSLQDVVSGSISDFRSTIRVFISFAVAAILLAAIGIYGLGSYWVNQRTYEIGLRVAIGATRQRVLDPEPTANAVRDRSGTYCRACADSFSGQPALWSCRYRSHHLRGRYRSPTRDRDRRDCLPGLESRPDRSCESAAG
jgi:hypothetical protein